MMIEALSLPISDSATVRLAAAMAFTFGAVFFFVVGVNAYMRARSTVRRRSVLDQGLASSEAAGDQGWFKNANSLRYQSLVSTSALLGDVERGASSDEGEASKLRREMLRAGFFDPRSVFWYQFTRVCLLFVAGVGAYLAHRSFLPDASANSSIMAGAFLGCIGFLLPSRFVAMRQNRVIQECREGFPDFIDLMIVCAEPVWALALLSSGSAVILPRPIQFSVLTAILAVSKSAPGAACIRHSSTCRVVFSSMKLRPWRRFSSKPSSSEQALPMRCASIARRCASGGS